MRRQTRLPFPAQQLWLFELRADSLEDHRAE